MQLTDILAIFGGLALFLFGMSLMGSSLEKCAGNRLKAILTKLTSGKLNGFLLGVGITVLIQSSSATTVMVVGFVNSGLMTLAQSVYIIIGANVGTAVTAWLLSLMGISGSAWYLMIFKPSTFTPVIALIGAAIYMFTKKPKRRDASSIMLGFAILMFGMEMMSNAVKPLGDMPGFTRLMTTFSNPIMGMLVGTLVTAVIQSSAASIGILQALSLTGSITYGTAIPVVMGQNIGTCITAMISSVGTSKDARRAAVMHLSFNVIGMVVQLSLFCAIKAIFELPFLQSVVSPLSVAVIHTLFKLITTAILMPFGNKLVLLANKLVPDGKDKKEDMPMLDERLFVTPSVAIESVRENLLEMAYISIHAVSGALNLLTRFDETSARMVQEAEDRVDIYEDKLGSYLVKLASHSMSESSSHELTEYLHMIGDLERLSDHAVNIMESAQELHEKKLQFPAETQRELDVLIHAVRDILDMALRALEKGDMEAASQVEPLEQVIDILNKEVRFRHISRLTHAQSTIEIGFVLTDVLSNLERVSDHCSNIAVCLIETSRNSFDMHSYLSEVKTNQAEFGRRFEQYRAQYALDAGQQGE